MRTFDGKNYPDKLFYRIQEVSDITGVKPYVLRYWETEFAELKPEKDERDQRCYRKADIELIFKIKRLLYDEHYTIRGACQQLLAERKKEKKISSSPAKAQKSDLQKQVQKIKKELHYLRSELQSLLTFLEKK